MIISWHQANCCHTLRNFTKQRLVPRQSWHLAIVCRVGELSFLSHSLSFSLFQFPLLSIENLYPVVAYRILWGCCRCWCIVEGYDQIVGTCFACSNFVVFHPLFICLFMHAALLCHKTFTTRASTSSTHTRKANHIIYRLSLAHSAGRKVSQRRQRVVWVIYASKSCSLRCIEFIYHLSAAAVAQQQESRV